MSVMAFAAWYVRVSLSPAFCLSKSYAPVGFVGGELNGHVFPAHPMRTALAFLKR